MNGRDGGFEDMKVLYELNRDCTAAVRRCCSLNNALLSNCTCLDQSQKLLKCIPHGLTPDKLRYIRRFADSDYISEGKLSCKNFLSDKLILDIFHSCSEHVKRSVGMCTCTYVSYIACGLESPNDSYFKSYITWKKTSTDSSSDCAETPPGRSRNSTGLIDLPFEIVYDDIIPLLSINDIVQLTRVNFDHFDLIKRYFTMAIDLVVHGHICFVKDAPRIFRLIGLCRKLRTVAIVCNAHLGIPCSMPDMSGNVCCTYIDGFYNQYWESVESQYIGSITLDSYVSDSSDDEDIVEWADITLSSKCYDKLRKETPKMFRRAHLKNFLHSNAHYPPETYCVMSPALLTPILNLNVNIEAIYLDTLSLRKSEIFLMSKRERLRELHLVNCNIYTTHTEDDKLNNLKLSLTVLHLKSLYSPASSKYGYFYKTDHLIELLEACPLLEELTLGAQPSGVDVIIGCIKALQKMQYLKKIIAYPYFYGQFLNSPIECWPNLEVLIIAKDLWCVKTIEEQLEPELLNRESPWYTGERKLKEYRLLDTEFDWSLGCFNPDLY